MDMGKIEGKKKEEEESGSKTFGIGQVWPALKLFCLVKESRESEYLTAVDQPPVVERHKKKEEEYSHEYGT